jgi:hypothetical protein
MAILYFLLGFLVTVLVIAAVVGTAWTIERSIVINASADRIWKELGTLRALNSWNPWSSKDPNVKLNFKGQDGAVGSSYDWDSTDKNVGAGTQTILSTDAPRELQTRVDFLRPFKGTGNSWLKLNESNGKTTVSWGMASSTPYPMNIIKVFGVIEKNMDKAFNEGLGELKRRSES